MKTILRVIVSAAFALIAYAIAWMTLDGQYPLMGLFLASIGALAGWYRVQ